MRRSGRWTVSVYMAATVARLPGALMVGAA